MTERTAQGTRAPLDKNRFYIGGSLLAARIDLIAVEPNFRGQSNGSFKLLLYALYGLEDSPNR